MDAIRFLHTGAKLYFWSVAAAAIVVVAWLLLRGVTDGTPRFELVGWMSLVWLLGLIGVFLTTVGDQPV